MKAGLVRGFATAVALFAGAGRVAAQSGMEGLGMSGAGLEGINVSGGGWSEWRNTDEALLFLVDVVTTLVLTAAIVYHPVRKRLAVSLASLPLPRPFFLYALVRMTVGFLVV